MAILSLRSLHLSVYLLLMTSIGCERRAQPDTAILRTSNWLHAAVEPEFLKLERDLVSEFEAAHPQVRIRVEPIPGVGQYAPRLLLMHVAGDISDAGYLDAAAGAVFINNGVVRDLSPFIENDPEFHLDDCFPNVVDSFRCDGKLYAIPLDFTPMVMYYNKRLFDAAGVPYPREGWTWVEFLETARRLAIAGDDPRRPMRQYAMHFENVMPFWILWLWNNGGDVLSPDGRQASGYLDGMKSVAAIEFLLKLMYDDRAAPSLQESAALGVDLFRAGRAAMDVKGHWMMIDYRAAGLDFGVVSLPTNTDRPVSVLYQSGLCVFARGARPDWGWQWIKFMTSYDVQVRRVASGLAISGNRRAADHFAGDPIEQTFLKQIEYARAPWGARVERYPFVEELGQEMMRTIINDAAALGGDRAARHALVQRTARDTAQLIDAALRE